MSARGWPLLVEASSLLCNLADRALAEDLGETGAAIAARARELLERAALEAKIDLGMGPVGDGPRAASDYSMRANLALARLSGLEVRLRAVDRYVEQGRREQSRMRVS